MRSELEQLEQIDQYLAGKMTPDQAAAFEAQMNADPVLKSMVNDQQLLIQTVSRKAMMAEINAVAGIAAGAAVGGGATAAGWGLTQWIVAAVTTAGVTAGGVAIYNAVTADNDTHHNELINENGSADQLSSENTFDTSNYYAFVPPVDELDVNESEDEIIAEENEKTVYRPEEDRTLENRKDPLNEFVNLHYPDHTDEPEVLYSYEETESSNGLVKNRRASFHGGHEALQKWFEKNLMYPGTAKEDKVQGTVRVRFLVKETGAIEIVDSECIQLLDEDGKLIDGIMRAKYHKAIKFFRRNAERAFRICPNWIPATNTTGTPVMSEQVWYVKYNLNSKTEVYSFGDDTGYLDEEIQEKGLHNYYSDDGIFFEVKTAEDEFIDVNGQ